MAVAFIYGTLERSSRIMKSSNPLQAANYNAGV
jgi:hypothetical protein